MNEISKIIDKLGISRANFCRMCSIPYRTVEDWVFEKRKPRKYVVDLINYRCGKIVYATTHYHVQLHDCESEIATTVDELKDIFKEYSINEDLENFDITNVLAKYSDENKYPHIKTTVWIAKKNLIGEYKYSVYNSNNELVFRATDMESVICAADMQCAYII